MQPHQEPEVTNAVSLPADIQRHLGYLLKASYNDILTAPIPDRFVELLNKLEQTPAFVAADLSNGLAIKSAPETASSPSSPLADPPHQSKG